MYLFCVGQKDSFMTDSQVLKEQIASKYDLVYCLSAKTLFAVAQKVMPDVILIDLDFLDRESICFFRDLRNKCSESIILALTNSENYEKLYSIIEQGGIDDYIFKPLTINEFIARIHIVTKRKTTTKTEPVEQESELLDISKSTEEFEEIKRTAEEHQYLENEKAAKRDVEDDYAERINFFETSLSKISNDKKENFFESPKDGDYAGAPGVNFDIGQEEAPESAGLLFDEDLERAVNEEPLKQSEGDLLPEEEFKGFFEEEPFQEIEKPAAEEVDLFADIIDGEADHDSTWDIEDSRAEEKIKPVTKLDKLPEPFDAEFPKKDDREMDDFTSQSFYEPTPDEMPPAPPVFADENSGIPSPPDLKELQKIHRKPPDSGPPQPPEELFGYREEKKTSFDQVFTDKLEGHPQQPERQDEPISTVDEFESYFVEEDGEDVNNLAQEEKDNLPPSPEPPAFSPQDEEKKTFNKPRGKAINTVLNIIFSLMLVFIAIIAFFIIQAQLSDDPPGIAGYKVYIYMNDSMKPEIAAGSLVIVQDSTAADIKPGDVISFPSETDPDAIKASRVVQVNAEEGLRFVTRADTSSANDPNPVPSGSVIGKVSRTVPYLGYLFDYAQTREGLIMLIFIPGLLIIIYQLVKIFRYLSFKKRDEVAY